MTDFEILSLVINISILIVAILTFNKKYQRKYKFSLVFGPTLWGHHNCAW
ncbi:hypothetical protein KQI68_01685 [Peptoniphilus sp. MSJ-1]|uniref:Uncharacterized protein n=1 Tax=Peptoniphilus ovalis TaxID=2841503 RepID=A0ABS6FED0_9FIRM|nr:hypothetical protein [Peptoniphilus ovalis]MBU5668544.1 hypothetical protein [Peptoniphilus ovalis]